MIHESAIIYGKSTVGINGVILENVILGYPDRHILKTIHSEGIRIEDYHYDIRYLEKDFDRDGNHRDPERSK